MLQNILFQINLIFIHQRILKKIIHNCFLNIHHIIMISEGLCDTVDWSNDAENCHNIDKILLFFWYF